MEFTVSLLTSECCKESVKVYWYNLIQVKFLPKSVFFTNFVLQFDISLLTTALVYGDQPTILIISKSPYDGHTQPIFSHLKLLQFENIIKLQLCKLMFLYQKGFLPESFHTIYVFYK